jgi:hypothetical protein
MFFQACYRDEVWLCEPTLPELLAVIVDLHHPGDVTVWCGPRVVVVCHPDDSRTWLAADYRPADESAAAA